MPIYEYQCLKCGKDHEVLQKFSDPPMKTCPDCKGKVEKKISASSFHLKGGGWYKDGYSSAKSATDASTSSSTEIKPATVTTEVPSSNVNKKPKSVKN